MSRYEEGCPHECQCHTWGAPAEDFEFEETDHGDQLAIRINELSSERSEVDDQERIRESVRRAMNRRGE